MVMSADSPNDDHSPRSPVTGVAASGAASAATVGGANSPQTSRRRNLSSPWASVVRGDSEPVSSPTAAATGTTTFPPPRSAASRTTTSPPPIVAAAPEQPSAPENSPMESSGHEMQADNSEINSDSNAGRPRRHAWNTPVNGVEPGSVMGDAVSWPALSESTRPAPKSPVPDGSSSSSQGPIISQPPQRQANTITHANSGGSNMPARQRSRNRGGGAGGGNSSGSGPSSSAFTRPAPPPPPPPFPVFDYGNMVPPMLDPPVRGPRPVGGVGGSQPHTSNDHPSPRNNSRRGNYGPRPRGDGQYHNNHGGRRDQDRRDVHLPHQYVPPPVGYMPPPLPHGAAPFIAGPPPVRLVPGNIGFDMSPVIYLPTLPPDSFRPMTMVPPPPMLFAPNNDPLPSLIVKQIDYYFSDENLVKDTYLNSNMDKEGWVSVNLIAGFPRVQQLTKDVQLILDSMRNSTVVEVQGDKLRSRKRSNADSSSHQSGASPENALATSFQKVSMDNATVDANGTFDNQTNMSRGNYTSDETTATSQLANGGDTTEDVRTMN